MVDSLTGSLDKSIFIAYNYFFSFYPTVSPAPSRGSHGVLKYL